MLESKKNRLLLFTLLMLLGACLEKEEGCLDPNALNLDVTADVNANCSYPILQFKLSQVWGSDNYLLNGRRALTSGDTLSINSFQCFISDVRLGGATELLVFDSVIQDDGNFIHDDLTILSLDALSFDIGHVNSFGQYDLLNFEIGYDQEWNNVDTALLIDGESGHPWFEESMIGADESRYVLKMDYSLINRDTVKREIALVGPRTKLFSSVGDFRTLQANHAEVNLRVDYETLLDGIDLRSASDFDVSTSMWMNIDNAIQISE